MPVRYYYSINDMLRYASPDENIHKNCENEDPEVINKHASSYLSNVWAIINMVRKGISLCDKDDFYDDIPCLHPSLEAEEKRLDEFFRKMIDRTYNHSIVISDVELDWDSNRIPTSFDGGSEYQIVDDENCAAFCHVFESYFARLYQFFDSTYKRYALILSAYENKLDDYQKALARVGSDSTHETRFNDTPQDTATPAADTHLTTYTRDTTESSSDMNTIMTRIAELEAKMSDVYKNWTDEYINQFSVI